MKKFDLDLLLKGVKEENPSALRDYGEMLITGRYIDGVWIAQDKEKAIYLLNKAVYKGDINSFNILNEYNLKVDRKSYLKKISFINYIFILVSTSASGLILFSIVNISLNPSDDIIIYSVFGLLSLFIIIIYAFITDKKNIKIEDVFFKKLVLFFSVLLLSIPFIILLKELVSLFIVNLKENGVIDCIKIISISLLMYYSSIVYIQNNKSNIQQK